ncbi:SDR family NAD(P)-dependent oxidoreductase [Citricoccus sp. GCM10030269]|uniref:SDR family NAD(P)-dependent oxidoreductase n=1 Tax=Citricoccus sp. GCM10030269 TaxID=3273388 RepID=UPI00360ABFE1
MREGVREVVIVGGASGQLGSTLVPLLASRGWEVLAWDVRSGTGHWLTPDDGRATEPTSFSEAWSRLDQDGSNGPKRVRVHAVVALSGRFAAGPFTEEAQAAEAEMFDANYFSVTRLLRDWLPALSDGAPDATTGTSAGQESSIGRFITISTTGVLDPYGGAATYVATKGAVLALTQALNEEFFERGVRGHCLVCGPMVHGAGPEPGSELEVGVTTYAAVAETICGIVNNGGPVVTRLPDQD